MATVQTITYSANTAITFDISSLTASPTWVLGRESTEIDNTTNLYLDCLVDIKGILCSATANVVGQEARLYCWGSDVSLATTPIGVLDGTDSAETVTVETLAALRLAGSYAALATTANLTFYLQPFSVASLFGGIMPKFWGLFFTTSLGGSTAAAQTGLFQYTGIKFTST